MNPKDTTLPPDHDDGSELEAGTPEPAQRRTRRTRGRQAPPPDSNLDELDSAALDEEARITEILNDELNNAANLEVYRKDKSGRWAFLETQPLAEWGPEAKSDLAKRYGGGEYKGRVRRMADGVRGSWGPSFHFTIDMALKPKDDDRGPAGFDPREMFSLFKESDKTMPLMMQMMQMQTQATQLMMSQMQKSNETLVTVLTAALTRPAAPPPPAPSEKLIEILATKALNPPAPRGISDLAEVIKAVAQLKNIANAEKEVDTDGRERPSMLDSLIESVPSLLKMLGGVITPPEPQPAQVVHPAAPAQLPANPGAPLKVAEPATEVRPEPFAPITADLVNTGPAPVREASVSADDIQALAAFVPSLVQLCDAGKSPGEVAEEIDRVLPDAVFMRMVDLLKRPDWLALLIDAHEPVQMRTPFFTELRNELIAMSEDDGD